MMSKDEVQNFITETAEKVVGNTIADLVKMLDTKVKEKTKKVDRTSEFLRV